MLRGFYTSVSGIVAGMAHANVIADNLANLNTTGFRASRTGQGAFELEVLLAGGQVRDAMALGTYARGPVVDGSTGSIEITGRPTDLAIEGDGLFVVGTPQGIAYTRGGDFVIDATGLLTTQQGHLVLDTDGRPIRVDGGPVIGPDGTVAGTGQRLALVAWPADGVLRLGGNLLAIQGDVSPASGRVRQGALESSNVSVIGALTSLSKSSMAFSARSLAVHDASLDHALAIGKVK